MSDDVAFGNGRMDGASMPEATLGERAWLAQQRRLEVRLDDVRLELLDGARSRHDVVLQAAGNIVRKALLFCQQEFERLGGLISVQDKTVARLEAEAAEQRMAFDQRIIEARAEMRSELMQDAAAGIAAERDKRQQILAGQASLINAQDKAIVELKAELAERQRTIDVRLDAFWSELGRRTTAAIAAEREQRERVTAEQASLVATREKEITALEARLIEQGMTFDQRFDEFRGEIERRVVAEVVAERERREQIIAEETKVIVTRENEITALEAKLLVEKSEASKRFAAFRGDLDRQIAAELKVRDDTFAAQVKRIETQDWEIAALETKLVEQETAADRRFDDFRAESERRMVAELGHRDETIKALWSANTSVRHEIERAATVGQVFGEERDNQREAIANIKDRVLALETTNSFEERFTKLAHEIKNESDIPQSELLARIDGLQRQLDELKRVAAHPGPQGPPGPPGKLACVKHYVAECVHYESDVVTHVGALWQARRDIVHAPPHGDWVCLARAGRDGLTPIVRGAYDVHEAYKKLDIVALDGAAFIAGHDNPGICPGNGWELLSRQGRPGRRGETGERGVRGEKGERGEPGEPAVTIASWQVDRRRYAVAPMMSDGNVGAILPLRELFEQFQFETS